MEEKTVASVVAHFKRIKDISYGMYSGNVNQFLVIIEGTDPENIARDFYPGKDLDFFRQVLQELGEL